MKAYLAVLISMILVASLCPAQDMEAGRRAANRGDFQTALRNWEPLAEAGDPEAQYNVARMYARGDGVRRDFKRAFELFREAALQGHRKAAEKLAVMYERGDGVSRDSGEAKYWKQVASGRIKVEPEPKKQEAPAAETIGREGEAIEPAEESKNSNEWTASTDEASGTATSETAAAEAPQVEAPRAEEAPQPPEDGVPPVQEPESEAQNLAQDPAAKAAMVPLLPLPAKIFCALTGACG